MTMSLGDRLSQGLAVNGATQYAQKWCKLNNDDDDDDDDSTNCYKWYQTCINAAFTTLTTMT